MLKLYHIFKRNTSINKLVCRHKYCIYRKGPAFPAFDMEAAVRGGRPFFKKRLTESHSFRYTSTLQGFLLHSADKPCE